MRKPTDKDLHDIQDILQCAKRECIGERLAAVLQDMEPEIFEKMTVITDRLVLKAPHVKKSRGFSTVVLLDAATGREKDIDTLPAQFRWDAVCAIWNEINCFEL